MGHVRHLYVHLPFCAHRCGYCDFVTVVGRSGRHGAYVDALLAELALEGDVLAERVETVFLRGGFRYRTLPFQADSNTVTEKSFTAGFGTTFANQRALADVALIHALRTADVAATERAWTISIGLSIRP